MVATSANDTLQQSQAMHGTDPNLEALACARVRRLENRRGLEKKLKGLRWLPELLRAA